MKKFLTAVFLLVFSFLPCFAEYNPIPKDRHKEFKSDIEKLLDKEVPKLKKEANEVLSEAKFLYKKLNKNGYNYDDYMNLLLCSEISIWSFDEKLDTRMIQCTQQKYFNNVYNPYTIEDFYENKKYLYKNLKETNVDTSKINSLIKHEKNCDKEIKKYIKKIQKKILPKEEN